MQCSICLEELMENDNVHLLHECEHPFHTECIITWFRSGNQDCPLCRGFPSLEIGYMDIRERTKLVIQEARKKNADPWLKRQIKAFDKSKKVFKTNITNLKNFQTEHKEILVEWKKLLRKKRNSKFSIERKKIQIGMMDCSTLPSVSLRNLRF